MSDQSPKSMQRLWRIIRAIALFQVVGGVIGLAINYHFFWFYNLWIGLAFGTLPGYFVGYLWQNREESETRREWIGDAVSLGLFAILFVVLGASALLPRMVAEMHQIGELQRFDTEVLREIEVFDEDALRRLDTIDDPESLSGFARAITDAQGYSPGGDRETSRSWYLIVHGTKKYEFELRTSPSFPGGVIGNIVSRTPNSLRNHGAFSSNTLRQWVEENLP